MYIRHKIKFILHIRKTDETTNLGIRMRVSLSGKTVDFALGNHVDLDYWDGFTQRAIPGFVNKDGNSSDDINREIDEYKSAINDVFARYELIEKRIPDIHEIRELFDDISGRKVHPALKAAIEEADFFRTMDLFVETMSVQNQWTDGTCEKFRALKQHLSDFNANLSFGKTDDSTLQKYVTYLEDKGFRNTTIAKSVALIRWYLRWAHNNGYYRGKSHDTFRPKFKGISPESKEVIYLSTDELEKMRKYEFGTKYKALERVRDVFLFCCYTGLRYSDVAKLKKTDLRKNSIHIVTQKTIDGLDIEYNRYSQEILDKYKDVKFTGGTALPVISNQKMNDQLKVIGEMSKIDAPVRVVFFRGNERVEEVYYKWQLLTTHCGRRTFVVTALQLGIPAEVIMRWTGHSSYNAMKPYVKIVDRLKKESMSKFDDLYTKK